MKTKTYTMNCRCCGGTGRIELTGCYLATLQLLRRETRGGRGVYAVELAKLVGCKATAMNNRLAYLEQHGFVTHMPDDRNGRKKLYVETEGKQ